MKLKSKLLVAFVVAAIVPLAGISFLVTEKVRSVLTENAVNQLVAARESREQSLGTYFNSIETQIQLMAEDHAVIDAAKEFSKAYQDLESSQPVPPVGSNDSVSMEDRLAGVKDYYTNQFGAKLTGEYGQTGIAIDPLVPASRASVLLQSLYIAANSHEVGSKNNLHNAQDGSTYSMVHKYNHAYFNDFLNAYGFYDIFIADPETGNVVYSVYKELDYATSLKTGPYAASGIGDAFNAALLLPKGESYLTDFNRYLPSYNQPASFISAPLYDAGAIVGVLIYQMPLDLINQVVVDRLGMGDTSKAYLVGDDGLMRTQMPFVEEPTILVRSVDTEELLRQQADGAGEIRIDDRGVEVLRVSKMIDVLGAEWLLVVEQDVEEAFVVLDTLTRIMLIMNALGILLALTVAYLIVRNTEKQLGADPTELNKIAAEIADGDLSRQFDNVESQTGTLKMMSVMQTQLKDREQADQASIARIGRLSQGLEKLTTMVCLAAEDHSIVFVNSSMRDYMNQHRAAMSSLNPGLNSGALEGMDLAVLSDNQSAFRSVIGSLSKCHESEITAGDRIINVKLNAIWSDDGVRLGTSMEWVDITEQRRVMDEVDSVVRAANNGCLSERIDSRGKQGVYLALAGGVNGLLDVTQHIVEDVQGFLSGISEGDLTKTIDTDYKGSFADVKGKANVSVEKLTEIVQSIRSVASTVDTAAREINTGNIDLSQRTERAAASLQETSSSMEEMTSSVKQNADNSKQAKAVALSAKEEAEKGGQVVGQAVQAMAEINESSRKISDIIGVIDDIAFQTNLLALNASVEAARAGEQGRGFAVVASEVRNLAGRSATAAKEIKDLIEDSVNRVENGAELVNESGRSLGGIVSQVKKVTDIVSEISAASQEQSEGITLVNQAIVQLDEATQQNAALVEEASAASHSTTEQVENLIKLIGFFNTGKSAKVTALNSVRPARITAVRDPDAHDKRPELGRKSVNSANFSKPANVANSDTDANWEEF